MYTRPTPYDYNTSETPEENKVIIGDMIKYNETVYVIVDIIDLSDKLTSMYKLYDMSNGNIDTTTHYFVYYTAQRVVSVNPV